MQKLVLSNCRILSPYGYHDFIDRGYIAVENGTIRDVGKGDHPAESDAQVIDLDGKTVLPGMINLHTHLYTSLLFGMPEVNVETKNWLERLKSIVWKWDQLLDEQALRSSFEIGILESLRSGVTTLFDHHSSQNLINGSLDILAGVAERLKVNVSSGFEITDRNGMDNAQSGIDENVRFIEKQARNPYILPAIGLHASFTLTDEILGVVEQVKSAYQQSAIHIHVAEDQHDVTNSRDQGYSSPIERLQKFNLLDELSLLVHCVHISNADASIVREYESNIVHCPTSNASSKVGILPDEYITGLKTGIGSDGKQPNLISETYEGSLIRAATQSGRTQTFDYLRLLFKQNAEIATELFNRKIGFIDEGYQADFAIYEYFPRTEIMPDNMNRHILFGLGMPSDVITRGEFRIRDYRFVDVQESVLKEISREQSMRLWEQMQK